LRRGGGADVAAVAASVVISVTSPPSTHERMCRSTLMSN
jgi:hypothetical protein